MAKIYQVQPIQVTENLKSVAIPGSKSDTNRALVIASLAKGKSRLQGISESDDSRLLIKALQQLGVKFHTVNNTDLEIFGLGAEFKPFFGELNCGIAGTTGRFLAAISALVPGNFVLTGEKKMLERPMLELLEALKQLGCQIDYLQNHGCLPVRFVNPEPISKIQKTSHIRLKGNISSQFFTALLLIAPTLPLGLTIEVIGNQVSKSYIDMTQSILGQFGVEMLNENYKRYTIRPDQTYQAKTYQVEGDASGCSYFWGIAAITGQAIQVANIDPNSVQGDIKFADILGQMGCQVTKDFTQKTITVKGPVNCQQLKPITVDMENMPDTAQTLAVVAAFAPGKTKITGLSTLKDKETNRLVAMQTELAKMQIQVDLGPDWMLIYGGNPKAAEICTYNDHRMAMSFAVAGTKIPGIKIQNPEVVNKSFPEFWTKLESLV